jgi:hypothetical protein
VLRRDLAIARARRSPDVELYEAALANADQAAVTKGVAVIVMMLIFVVFGLGTASAYLF